MAQHALDGEVGLAGIGGTEDCRDVANAVCDIEAHSGCLSRGRQARGIAEWWGKIKGPSQKTRSNSGLGCKAARRLSVSRQSAVCPVRRFLPAWRKRRQSRPGWEWWPDTE